MILYHGSNVPVLKPYLQKMQRNLDFGKGFYTTSDLAQAESWARRKAALLKSGSPVVSCYEVDESRIAALKTLRFHTADRAWLDYVVSYRKGAAEPDGYELVIGPVANDQTTQTLTLYLDGFLDADAAIRRLLMQRLKDQYAFRTESRLALLRLIEVKGE